MRVANCSFSGVVPVGLFKEVTLEQNLEGHKGGGYLRKNIFSSRENLELRPEGETNAVGEE